MTRQEILKNAKPILFNTDMVRAILDGRKTVTRRLCKLPGADHIEEDTDGSLIGIYNHHDGCVIDAMAYAPYKQGDILYVRETYVTWHLPLGEILYCYKATDPSGNKRPTSPEFDCDLDVRPWNPSIHMPKEAARIFLKVTNVRVERLQDIDDEQARAEGCDGRCECPSSGAEGSLSCTTRDFSIEKFGTIWNSTIKKSDLDRYGWDANPWVWVIEFERIEV